MLALILACTGMSMADARAEAWRGEKLADFLAALDEYGLRVIFSSDLVRDEYRLVDEPDLDDVETALARALAPFGLGITDGPGGSLLVVRLDAAAAAPSPPGDVRDDLPLPEIIVTSSLQRLELVRTTAHAYFDRELATRLPATAEEAVRLTNHLPGTASGGVSARNHVRGGEVNEVLFLLDGLRLYEPFHLKDFQSIATIVNSSVIEGIDMYSGAFPARFGDRMSGVMLLDLREPSKQTENELALSFFNASISSLGSFGAGERGDWLVSARRGNLDLVVDVVDPESGKPHYNDVFAHGGWEFGPKARVSANYLASTDKIRLMDAGRGEFARARYSNEVFWLNWSADWNPVLQSRTIAAHTAISNSRSGSLDLPGIVGGTLEESKTVRISSLKQDWTLTPSERWLVGFGFDVKHLDGDFDYAATRTLVPPFDSLFMNTPLVERSADIEADGGQQAVYAELRWQILPDLFAEAGVRWDQQDYTLAASDRQTSPRLSFLYRLRDATEFRLGWGQFSQAQEVNELQVSDGVYDYFPAQRAEHVVANLEHTFGNGVQLDLSLYRKSFRKLRPRFENAFNALSILPEIQFDRIRVDARSGRSRGGEIMLSRESDDRDFVWWLVYSWSSVEDETPAGERKRSWDQPHAGKGGLSWQWRGWNMSMAAQVHTGWPKTELIGRSVETPDGSTSLELETTPANKLRYGTFHTLDARISRDLDLRRGDLTVFLDVTNLYDSRNPCCLEYSLDPDADQPSLVRRQAHWLPLLPSLGIVWRF
jgi:hypothetical protein